MSLSVVAFVPHPETGASARYRVYQLLPALAARGIRVDVRPFHDEAGFGGLYRAGHVASKVWALARGARRRWRALAEAGRYDVALVHRELWPMAGGAPLRRLATRQPRWVYDFDDALWLPHVSEANRRFRLLKPSAQFLELAQGAHGVSAGNAWLAAWARGQRPGAESGVAVVPTPVDTARWAPRAREAGPPRLVWIGSHSTEHYLEPLRAMLPALGRRHPGLELHVIGGRFSAAGVRVVEHPWSLESEVALTARCDLGLAPLPDDPWTRGKCGLKLLLYMALGLPAVASPVGVHTDIVRDGENGVLAATPEAFEAAIDRLLGDAGGRAAMGRAARATVEREYSLDAVAPRLASLLEGAAS